MNGSAFHDECAFGWADDFACAAENAEGCIRAYFAVTLEKQGAGDGAYVEAVVAVRRAFFNFDVEHAVEYFANSYCAFRAFDFAYAAAWALLFLNINLNLQVVLVGVGGRLLSRDLFSIRCEQVDFYEV